MTAVERYFFTPLYYPRGLWSVVRWWESRRLVFNMVVGSAGILSVATVMTITRLPPQASSAPFPFLGIVVYGILANLCYSLGPLADLGLRRFLDDRAPAVGTVLLRYGFVFSVGLTLLPIPLAMLGWLIRLF